MNSKERRLPTIDGLKRAQENFKRLYKRRPSEELVKIISEVPPSGRKEKGIAAQEYSKQIELEA